MLHDLTAIAAAAAIAVPAESRLPIAIVGAGAIVDLAHLPAYRTAELEIRGIYDLDSERAAEVANRHGVSVVYPSLDELLADEQVAVVDIAVSPSAQPGIARQAIESGKHLLCQKPLAPTPEIAIELAERAAAAGRKIAVNQQLRFSESIAASKAMIDAGWIGTPLSVRFDVDIATDWEAWPWLAKSERLEVQYHSIHYLDAIRFLVGDPEAVFCRGTSTPGATTVGETRTTSLLLYPCDLQASVMVNHDNSTNDPWASYRIDGSAGAISGTLGLLYDYPDGRPDTLKVSSAVLPTDGWLHYPVTSRWLPDAFLGPMASLLQAVADDGEPATGAADNVGTVRMVDALYASMGSSGVERLSATETATERTVT